ncbi:hypothetical protein [Luteolibacter sp. LG18]|uniref:hypothetical protein n=1 Tax=Luteolibacter sp. LG18 TaxID=2819286 RepID=UPI002B324D7B|nr:hypothetical protein llg_12920 [Luteolibacter sp. LG18]
MRFTNPILTLAASAALVSLSSAADETYILAKKDDMPKPGTKLIHSRLMAMKKGTVKVKVGDQALQGTCEMIETETEHVEHVSAEKIKRLLTAAEKSEKMTMNGQERPHEAEPNPLLNVPVTLSKADGEWTATIDGGKEPTAAQEKELSRKEKAMRKDEDVDMYGTVPRKVGDSWEVDASKALPFSEDEKDTQGTLKLTFKAVEEFQGKKCARLEGAMEMTGKTNQGQNITMKGNVIVFRSIEDREDLKVTITGTMGMSGEIPNGSMSMDGDLTMELTTKME